jgi:hypothetical protein
MMAPTPQFTIPCSGGQELRLRCDAGSCSIESWRRYGTRLATMGERMAALRQLTERYHRPPVTGRVDRDTTNRKARHMSDPNIPREPSVMELALDDLIRMMLKSGWTKAQIGKRAETVLRNRAYTEQRILERRTPRP